MPMLIFLDGVRNQFFLAETRVTIPKVLIFFLHKEGGDLLEGQ